VFGSEYVATYFIQDAAQGVSYLQSRPEVDPKRIGAFGCSGGGTVTAYLAALDARVQAAAVACYVNDYSHLLATVGPQDAEQSIPNFISSGLDIPDWVELAAPKPYLVISTTEDMFPFAGATAAVDEAKHVWTVLGAPDNLVWATGPGPHGAIAPMGDKIVGFFRKSLNVPGEAVPFAALKPAREEDLMVTPTAQLVTSIGTKTYALLELDNMLNIRYQNPNGADEIATPIAAFGKVTATPGASPKAQQVSETTADGLTTTTLSFPSPMGPLEARVLKPAATSKVVLVLDPAPLDVQTGPRGRAKAWLKAGYTVVTLQVRGADGTEESKSTIAGDENLLSLRVMLNGHTLPGIRIDDAIRAMDWVAANFKGVPVTLDGVGIMGPVALETAALDKRVTSVRTESAMVSFVQALYAPMARDLAANAIPQGLYFFDLPDIMEAIGPRQVDIAVPVAPNGTPMREKDFRYWVGTPPNVRYLPNLDLP
jgi:cephalosporin-C deacetylase-like acetyl esterase